MSDKLAQTKRSDYLAKRQVLDLLSDFLLLHPTWRIGQAIANLMGPRQDIYGFEDAELRTALLERVGKYMRDGENRLMEIVDCDPSEGRPRASRTVAEVID